jgi:hypothetical protein
VRDERLAADGVGERLPEALDRRHELLALLERAAVAHRDADDGGAVHLLRQDRQRRRLAHDQQMAEAVGGVGGRSPEQRQHLLRPRHRMQHQSGDHLGPVGLRLELKRRDHAEVAAAAADRPEQIGVLLRARLAHLAVGRDDLDRAQVVGGETMAPADPAEAAAEREPGDAGGRDDAAGHDQSEGLCGAIDIGPGGAGLHAHAAGSGVDLDGFVRREIDHHAARAQRGAGDVVAAAADRQRQPTIAGEGDAGGDVGGAARPDHERRPALDHAVPDVAGLGVRGLPWRERRPTQAAGEGIEAVAIAGRGRGMDGPGIGHGPLPMNALSGRGPGYPARNVPRRFGEDKFKICTGSCFLAGV